jgi:osmotically-inducible protein OsmY
MIRNLIKLVLVVIVVIGVGAFLLGRWTTNAKVAPASPAGANIVEATENAANQAEDAIKHGAVTAKIKSKMVLDDLVKARNIHVETNGAVVTLTGLVDSGAERKRAVELAKETEGVTSVVDHLQVR